MLVGGMIGYLSSRALQDRESEIAARGSARVAQARLLQVADDLSVMVETRRAFDLRRTLAPDLDVDDRRVMASELSAEEWTDVLRSEASIRRLLGGEPLGENAVRSLDSTACGLLRTQLAEIVRGASALGGLAQVAVPEERRARYSRARC